MVAFLLVHGSGQNAASWSRVGDLLRARGHAVTTPELPKREASWRLEDHAAHIARSIDRPGTVVVAHSFSGAFLPILPGIERCALLVFLAAVIPEPGRSIREQFAADPSMFSREWIDAGARWSDEAEREGLAREFLFHDCDEATVEWAVGSLDPYDTRPLVVQPSPFTDWPAVPAVAIVATHDRTLTPDWGRRTSRRLLGREPIEIAAGHCPQISRAGETAGLIERLASDPEAMPRLAW